MGLLKNKQDGNTANDGDIAKHAALVALVQLVVHRNPSVITNWLDTHAYLIESDCTRKQVEEWQERLEALLKTHSGYKRYYEVQLPRIRRSKYLCSTGVALAAGFRKKLVRLFLSENNPTTRELLRHQLERDNHKPTRLLADVRDFANQDLAGFAGPVVALVDPLPPSGSSWPDIWENDSLGGWMTAKRTVETLHAAARDGIVLLYQWRRGQEAVTWPDPPRFFSRVATFACRQTRGSECSHHLAVFATAEIAADASRTLATLGWTAVSNPNNASDGDESGQGRVLVNQHASGPRFTHYIAADYSGYKRPEVQRDKIVVSEWSIAAGRAESPLSGMTRAELRGWILNRLQKAAERKERVLFAFDHQYAWPEPLLKEAGVADLPWREALHALRNGKGLGPPLNHPDPFCREFNRQVGKDVFFGGKYGLPKWPAQGFDHLFRLTEVACMRSGRRPKAANEIGTQGAVGGQTIHGMSELSMLLDDAKKLGVKIAVWPFDGLSLDSPAYEGFHVCVEIYPTLLRKKGVEQTDENDAVESARYLFERDSDGTLADVMDLSSCASDERLIRKEGWIIGVAPNAPVRPEDAPHTKAPPTAVNLTEEQEAVATCEDPLVRVIARAGTGKTTTMVHRAMHILKADPDSRVLMLTFTRNAADAMRSKFHNLHTGANDRFHASTFHGFALKCLLNHSGDVDIGGGLRLNLGKVSLLNEFGRQSVLDFYERGKGRKYKLEEVDNWADDISKAVNTQRHLSNRTPYSLLGGCGTFGQTAIPREAVWKGLLELYAREHLLDFDVIMVLFEYLLRTNSDFLASARGSISHVIVDEFQDTNYPQLSSVEYLAGYGAGGTVSRATQLLVVADDFQIIYDWRGAVSNIFARFATLSEKCTTLPMNNSFRSSSPVIDLVNATARELAKQPEHRDLCSLVPAELGIGCAREGAAYKTGCGPGSYSHVIRMLLDRDPEPSHITILARTNEEAKAAYDGLRKQRIPCDLITATPASIPGVQLFLALLTAWGSPRLRDFGAWWHLYSACDDRATAEYFDEAWAYTAKQDVRDNARTVAGMILGDEHERELISVLADGRLTDADEESLAEIIKVLTARNASVAEDKDACLRVARALLQHSEFRESPLRVIGEMTRRDFAGSPDTNKSGVQISTIHQYKGLENRRVVFCGNFTPRDKTIDKLRLTYVARSRAMNDLVLLDKKEGEMIKVRRPNGTWGEFDAKLAMGVTQPEGHHVALRAALPATQYAARGDVPGGFPSWTECKRRGCPRVLYDWILDIVKQRGHTSYTEAEATLRSFGVPIIETIRKGGQRRPDAPKTLCALIPGADALVWKHSGQLSTRLGLWQRHCATLRGWGYQEAKLPAKYVDGDPEHQSTPRHNPVRSMQSRRVLAEPPQVEEEPERQVRPPPLEVAPLANPPPLAPVNQGVQMNPPQGAAPYRIQVYCGDSHSLWQSHDPTGFDNVMSKLSALHGSASVRMSFDQGGSWTNTRLSRKADNLISWKGAGCGGTGAKRVRVWIEF